MAEIEDAGVDNEKAPGHRFFRFYGGVYFARVQTLRRQNRQRDRRIRRHTDGASARLFEGGFGVSADLQAASGACVGRSHRDNARQQSQDGVFASDFRRGNFVEVGGADAFEDPFRSSRRVSYRLRQLLFRIRRFGDHGGSAGVVSANG